MTVYREAQTKTVLATGITRGPGDPRGRAREPLRAARPPTAWSTTARASLPAIQVGADGQHAWFKEAVIGEENDDAKYESLVQDAVNDYRSITGGVTPAMVAERQRLLRDWVAAYKTWRDV